MDGIIRRFLARGIDLRFRSKLNKAAKCEFV